jgi:hypothetical protein
MQRKNIQKPRKGIPETKENIATNDNKTKSSLTQVQVFNINFDTLKLDFLFFPVVTIHLKQYMK